MEFKRYKIVRSENYNYNFDRVTGEFARWGKTLEDDPLMAPAPEILDLEISTICYKNCRFCYKSNTSVGLNMNFETFKKLFHKMPRNLMQIAFAIGSIDANPDLYKIMEYCRNNNYNYVVPNITINGDGLTNYHADKLISLVGACAVSHYSDDACFDSVKKLTDRGLKQCNIHQLFCREKFDECLKLLESFKNDDRLSKLNAIVFLLIKPKYRIGEFNLPTEAQFKQLIETCLNGNINMGFDSCSAQWFEWVIKQMNIDEEQKKSLIEMSESCESGCQSGYINVKGDYYPCSFSEGVCDWKDGISVLNCEDFIKDVWFNERVIEWRRNLLTKHCKNGCRSCAVFPSINIKEVVDDSKSR